MQERCWHKVLPWGKPWEVSLSCPSILSASLGEQRDAQHLCSACRSSVCSPSHSLPGRLSMGNRLSAELLPRRQLADPEASEDAPLTSHSTGHKTEAEKPSITGKGARI